MRILLPALAFLCLMNASAQDSVLHYNVQRMMLQPTLSPSMNYDNGKNVVFGAIQHTSILDKTLLNEADLAYSTHFGRHSFGINFHRMQSNLFQISTSLGAQYAYTIKLNPCFLGKNVAIIPGIGFSYNEMEYDFSKLKFGDQIDDRLGFIKPTAERAPMEKIKYPTFQLSALIRSPKFYVQYQVLQLLNPSVSFYYKASPSDQFKLPILHQFYGGYKLFEVKQFSLWATARVTLPAQTALNGVGLTATVYKKIMMSYLQMNQSVELSLGYYSNKFRVFTRYQNTPNPDFAYFTFGKYSLGFSVAIGKQ